MIKIRIIKKYSVFLDLFGHHLKLNYKSFSPININLFIPVVIVKLMLICSQYNAIPTY